MRTLFIIVAIVLALIGLTFISSRGGHESYDAKTFKPGPVIGMLKGLSADELQGRAIGSAGSQRAQEMIESRMQALELLKITDSYRHPFEITVEDKVLKGTNLIGVIGGTSKSLNRIILTAHYDHVGVKNGEIYNGADDNASGVAALFAVAEHFKRKKTPPKHTLVFVFFDGEESDLAGAKALMADPPLPQKQFAFNLNLDMVARADNGTLWASGAYHTPALTPLIEGVAKDAPLVLKQGFDGSNPDQDDWTTQSDHAVFHEAGIPYLYLGVEDHKDYHKPTDTFENIDQDTFLKSVETVVQITMALDEQLEEVLGLPPLEKPEE